MASGDSLVVCHPLGNEPPGTAFATLDFRNFHPVLDFDDTTDENAVWTSLLPDVYDGLGITVYIHYAMTTATTGAVVWNVSFERIGDQQQDLDTDGFAAAQAVTVTVPGTSGLVDITSITFTDGAQIDNIAVGDSFRVRVTRDADNASDTATGDAELVMVSLVET